MIPRYRRLFVDKLHKHNICVPDQQVILMFHNPREYAYQSKRRRCICVETCEVGTTHKMFENISLSISVWAKNGNIKSRAILLQLINSWWLYTSCLADWIAYLTKYCFLNIIIWVNISTILNIILLKKNSVSMI